MPRSHLPWMLLVALLAPAGHAVELERDDRPRSPLREPLAAWQAAQRRLGDAVEIRRIAFADHGMFVFYSPPGERSILALHIDPGVGEFVAEDDGRRGDDLCALPGLSPDAVERALRRLLASAGWQTRRAQLDGLFLECHGDRLHWALSTPPPGGYAAGVPIEFATEPLDPGVEAAAGTDAAELQVERADPPEAGPPR